MLAHSPRLSLPFAGRRAAELAQRGFGSGAVTSTHRDAALLERSQQGSPAPDMLRDYHSSGTMPQDRAQPQRRQRGGAQLMPATAQGGDLERAVSRLRGVPSGGGASLEPEANGMQHNGTSRSAHAQRSARAAAPARQHGSGDAEQQRPRRLSAKAASFQAAQAREKAQQQQQQQRGRMQRAPSGDAASDRSQQGAAAQRGNDDGASAAGGVSRRAQVSDDVVPEGSEQLSKLLSKVSRWSASGSAK